jgi:hypothetical protein
MQLRTVWSDYFTGTPTSLQPKVYGTRQTPSDTSVYVSNCLFGSITSSSAGGALFCDSVTYLLVESSSFFTCTTSASSGGAIYFSYGSGQCVLHEVCGYDCYSTYTSSSYGQFAYIYVNNVASSKNYVSYSSISRCVYTSYYTYNILDLRNGNICLPSVNISLNKIYARSAVYCTPSVDSNSVTCSLSYSSFADNFATESACIQLYRSGAKYEVISCNVLRNTDTTSSRGTFYTYGNVLFEDSCILENKATYIFRFGSSSYTVTLSNCTIDSTSNNGNVVMTKTVTKSFIHALNHMSTRDCHSEYDSAGTLTPIIQTPSSTKYIRYYTCMRLFYQRPQVDLISLISFLIFNFIHPYASIYPLL